MLRPRWPLAVALLVLASATTGCGGRNRSGALAPPRDAAPWTADVADLFDDDLTATVPKLSGRAPNDVLDQELFQARLGLASLVLRVRVEQVWARGLEEGVKRQYLDVKLEETLVGTLPRGTESDQLVEIRAADPLPGALRGQSMLLFVRWAPGLQPAYHHHVLPADREAVAYVRSVVAHARKAGAFQRKAARTRKAEARRRKAD